MHEEREKKNNTCEIKVKKNTSSYIYMCVCVCVCVSTSTTMYVKVVTRPWYMIVRKIPHYITKKTLPLTSLSLC